MTRLLISVASLEEAYLAACCRVDLIDLKDPSRGALGALAPSQIGGIIAYLPEFTFSATCGDRPFSPELLPTVKRLSDLGVDLIKIGLFPPLQLEETLRRLSPLAGKQRLVAVVLADLFEGDLSELLPKLKGAGFYGAMLDVAEKGRGALPDLWSLEEIGRFVQLCRQFGLTCGLAGALALHHIDRLLPLAPDYLGFRSAACEGGREGPLSRERLVELRERIPPLAP